MNAAPDIRSIDVFLGMSGEDQEKILNHLIKCWKSLRNYCSCEELGIRGCSGPCSSCKLYGDLENEQTR